MYSCEFVSVYIHTHMYTCIYIYQYIWIYIYMYGYIYIHMYMYMYMCVDSFIHSYICYYIYINKCMNIYIYIHIYFGLTPLTRKDLEHFGLTRSNQYTLNKRNVLRMSKAHRAPLKVLCSDWLTLTFHPPPPPPPPPAVSEHGPPTRVINPLGIILGLNFTKRVIYRCSAPFHS